MAYINAEEVREIRNNLKKTFPEIKFSVRKEHHSSVHVDILKGPYDFELNGKTYRDVNHYHYDTDTPGKDYDDNWIKPHSHRDILRKILAIISEKHWDKSDIMIDYFNCAFYYHLSIGTYDKPYVYLPKAKAKKIGNSLDKKTSDEVVKDIIKAFAERGITDAVPKENVFTYNIWKHKKDRIVKHGEKGVNTGRYTVFHISQTEKV